MGICKEKFVNIPLITIKRGYLWKNAKCNTPLANVKYYKVLKTEDSEKDKKQAAHLVLPESVSTIYNVSY